MMHFDPALPQIYIDFFIFSYNIVLFFTIAKLLAKKKYKTLLFLKKFTNISSV